MSSIIASDHHVAQLAAHGRRQPGEWSVRRRAAAMAICMAAAWAVVLVPALLWL